MTLPNLDDDKYDHEHTDGTHVTVNISERKNGGRIGAYWYDENHEKQAYFSFGIEDVDTGKIHLKVDKEVPEAVLAALHSGGWRIKNSRPVGASEVDPTYVALLDARDIAQQMARNPMNEYQKIWAEVTVEMLEECLAGLILTHMSDDAMAKVVNMFDAIQDNPRVTGPEDLIWTRIEMTAKEQRSPSDVKFMVDELEDVRREYREGTEWEDALGSLLDEVREKGAAMR